MAAAHEHPAGTPADHVASEAQAARDASGAVDHTAMTIISGQTDGTTVALLGLTVLVAGGRALTRLDRQRLGRKTVVGTAVVGLLSAVVGLPAGAATAAPPTKDGGGTTTATAPAFCPSDARRSPTSCRRSRSRSR